MSVVITLLITLAAVLVEELCRWIWRSAARPRRFARRPGSGTSGRGAASALDLRMAQVDIGQSLARYGRVPIERPPKSSFFANVGRFLRQVTCGPSSPKPAFAVRSLERTPSGADEAEPGLGGFRLTVELHEAEHCEHFRRSIRTSADGSRRTVAVCSPDRLSSPGNRVRCYLVNAELRRIRGVGDGTQQVCLESADPLGAPHGHEWQPRLNDVPGDAIWLVDISEIDTPDMPTARSGGWRSAWQQRYRRLLEVAAVLVYLVVLPAFAMAALAVMIHWMLVREGWWLTPFTWAVYVTVVVAWLVLVWASRVVINRCCAYWFRERRWRGRWTADTLTCLDDAAEMRNGLADPAALRR